jgi:hypothetical protein
VLAEKTAGLESAVTETEARRVAVPTGGATALSKPTTQGFQELADKEHLLAGLRSAHTKMVAYTAELDNVGIALSRGIVGVDDALRWLDNIGAMVLFDVQTPEAQCSRQ